ncbi:hypothetical protein AJ79_05223 [Helicocarpus griseus UAMH5409]|uniref:Uncharacterized protein n=1 Tax=Helicocarpus griseus UAMH5409 TaxID=1447875 RepID=A0A2B7XQ24_9EURO|nr:hypothetical protein AJ79_05223 [Helicocarpus griseus UAMH5409]
MELARIRMDEELRRNDHASALLEYRNAKIFASIAWESELRWGPCSPMLQSITQSSDAGNDQQPNHRAQEKTANDILELLRPHYMRKRSDLEARDLIEGKDASDKNLYFDASGQKRAEDIIDLIDRMSVGRFGATLAYVYLPATQDRTNNESAAKPPKKSYSMNQGITRQSLSHQRTQT